MLAYMEVGGRTCKVVITCYSAYTTFPELVFCCCYLIGSYTRKVGNLSDKYFKNHDTHKQVHA